MVLSGVRMGGTRGGDKEESFVVMRLNSALVSDHAHVLC